MTPRADDDPGDGQSGDVPEGVGGELYARHLEHLSRHEAYRDAVLSFPDAAGGTQDVALDQVTEIDDPSEGSSRWRIRLRNGAIVLASGAVIAAAIAALRYRRARK
jgi:hypothetical protein